jgi:hypothetical protein
MSGAMLLPRNDSGSSSRSRGKMANGCKTESLNGNGVTSMIDPEAVRSSVAQVLHDDQPISSDSKTEFVRQVLKLLQVSVGDCFYSRADLQPKTDESFSEKLYMDYIARA